MQDSRLSHIAAAVLRGGSACRLCSAAEAAFQSTTDTCEELQALRAQLHSCAPAMVRQSSNAPQTIIIQSFAVLALQKLPSRTLAAGT